MSGEREIDCREAEQLLSDMVAGALTCDAPVTALEKHLAECPRCSERLEALYWQDRVIIELAARERRSTGIQAP